MGEISAGWEVRTLGSVSEILNGHAFKSRDYVEEGIFVLRTKNFNDAGVVARQSDDVFLPEAFLESHPQYICEPFDFHMVMVGASLGKTALLLPHDLPALRNQNMWCFRASDNISRAFLRFSIDRLILDVMSWASGSARSFFRKSDFKNHQIVVPDLRILSEYQLLVEPMYLKISENTSENITLSNLRDTLLPKLISGELPIKNAEKFLEQAGV